MGIRIVLASLVAFVATAARAADVAQVELPKSGYDLAVNPQAGGVAVVNPADDTVTLYPELSARASAAGAITRTVPRAPLGIVYKRVGDKAYFAVVCQDGNKLVVFDAAALEPVKEIPLTTGGAAMAFASVNPADPYVYYTGGQGRDAPVACVNLATLREEGAAQGLGWRSSVTDGAISADGSLIYTRGSGSPTGFSAFRALPARAGQPGRFFSQLHYDHRSVDPYVTDALGLYVATGAQLYAADLKREVAKLPVASVACFLPDRPVIVGFAARVDRGGGRRFDNDGQDWSLQAVSYNTFKAVGEAVALDGDKPAAGAAGRRPSPFSRNGQPGDYSRAGLLPRVVYDPKHQNVLALTGGRVHVIPLKAFAAAAEPLLFVAANVPPALTVERKATVALKPADPAVKVELAAAPAGLALTANALEWTPTADQVGVHVVSLKLTGGGVERTQDVRLTVARNEVALPFTPQFSRLSSDGSAVVIGANARDPNDGGGGGPYGRATTAPAGSSRVALVGLDGRPAVERELLVSVTAVAADAKYAYVALRDSDALYVLDRKDLSDVKRLFTAGRTAALVSASDECLLIQTDKGTTAIDPRTLAPIEVLSSASGDAAAAARMGQDPSYAGMAGPQALGDGWLFDGVVYDAKLRTARSALRPGGIVAARGASAGAPGRRNFGMQMDGSRRPLFAPWGVYVEGMSLRRLGGQNVAQLPQGAVSIVLPSAPAAASLAYTAKHAENSSSGHAEVVLRDLVSGSPGATLVLFDGPVDPARAQDADRGRFYGSSPLQLYAAGDRLVALVYDRLYVVKTPALPAAQFPVPLHFSADQGVTVADAAAPVTKALAVRSAAADANGIEFSLAVEMPGLELDKAKGALTVTAGPLLQAAAETLAAADGSAAGVLGDGRGLAAYLPTASARFKQLTGRDPAGIPAMLPVTVNARDRSLQVATIEHAILLDVPREMVQAKVAAAAAGGTSRVGFGPRSTTRPTTMGVAGAAGGSSEERIEQLERKVQDLQAQVNVLMRLLGQRGDQ